MKEKIPLKYACMDEIDSNIHFCKTHDPSFGYSQLGRHLEELKELIIYQMQLIKEQRMEIVALKHGKSWQHYDKPIENYDPTTRKYIDKPAKSGNMSC